MLPKDQWNCPHENGWWVDVNMRTLQSHKVCNDCGRREQMKSSPAHPLEDRMKSKVEEKEKQYD